MSARRLKAYPAYKDSGVEWLGEIPAAWEVRRLRSTITSCQNGIWGEEPDGAHDVPCVRVADFDRATFRVRMVNPTLRSIEERVVEIRGLRKGDLLLEKSGGGDNQPVGAVVLYDHDTHAVCSNFVARVTVARGCDPRFLSYLHAGLYAWRINIRHIKQSTGIQNLDGDSYLSEAVGLPSEDEQRAIAAFLDRETVRIDELVAKKERLIELLQEQRTALITRAVTKGLEPNVPMKNSGVEWLGEVPAHWEVKRISHLTPSDRRIMYGIVLPGPNVEDGVPIVKGGDVSPDRLHLDRLSRTAREIECGYVRSRLRGGDIVYAIRGSIGEVAIVPDELEGANLTQDAARISYTTATHGGWLLFALKSTTVFAQLEAGALGATIKGINIRDLKRASLAVPPPDEQCAIAAFVDGETEKLDALVANVRYAIARLQELRTALISAAVTGKIDVREEAA
jgi:type I restriction enzyme S subunit